MEHQVTATMDKTDGFVTMDVPEDMSLNEEIYLKETIVDSIEGTKEDFVRKVLNDEQFEAWMCMSASEREQEWKTYRGEAGATQEHAQRLVDKWNQLVIRVIQVDQVESEVQWAKGDLWNDCENGERKRICSIYKWSYNTWSSYGRVAAAFDIDSDARANFSYTHCREVLKVKDIKNNEEETEKLRLDWLKRATDEDMSTRELKETINKETEEARNTQHNSATGGKAPSRLVTKFEEGVDKLFESDLSKEDMEQYVTILKEGVERMEKLISESGE